MGIVRGKVWHSDYYPLEHYVGSAPLWERCVCGRWKDRNTGEHIEVNSYNLNELLELEKIKCPDQEDK